VVKIYDRMEVLKYIDDYWKRNFISPSIREIGKEFEIGSTSTVFYILRDLEGGGHIEIIRDVARGIVPMWLKDLIREVE